MSRRSRTRRPIDRRPRTSGAPVRVAVAEKPLDARLERRAEKAPAPSFGELASDMARVVGEWAPIAGRVLLGLVLAWFGYHELVQPGLWTGYVPVLSPHSELSDALVLVHGWVLFVLAAALIFGFAIRISAAVAAVLLFEIVISLIASGGLSDLVLRDVGVLGLACSLIGNATQRFALAA